MKKRNWYKFFKPFADRNNHVMYWIVWSDGSMGRFYSHTSAVLRDVKHYAINHSRYYRRRMVPLKLLTEDKTREIVALKSNSRDEISIAN